MADTLHNLQRGYWGPLFWNVLHTLAECSGQFTNTIEEADEMECWKILLRLQASVMPCPLCKQHYLEYYMDNKINNLTDRKGVARRQFLREWLWKCHDRVNEMYNKQSPLLIECASLYKKKSIEKDIKQIYIMFENALLKQQLHLEDISRWKNTVSKLRKMYSV